MAARRRAALAYNTDDFAVSINRMQSLSRFAIQVPSTSRFEMKPPTLEATKFEELLTLVATHTNNVDQTAACNSILTNSVFHILPMLEPQNYVPKRKVVVLINVALSLNDNIRVHQALMYLLAAFVRDSPSRSKYLVENNTLQKIVDMFVQNEETTLAYDSDEQILALKRSILFFFASFTSISPSECHILVDSSIITIGKIGKMLATQQDFMSQYAATLVLRHISFVTELRPRIDVRSLGNLCLFLKSLGSSSIPHNEALGMEEMALMSNTRENVCLIIRNLTAHNSATKNFFSEQVIVQWLAEILLTSDHHEATQFHALFALAHHAVSLPEVQAPESQSPLFPNKADWVKCVEFMGKTIKDKVNPKKHLVFASIYALSHLLIKCTSFIGAIVHEQRLVPYLSKIIAASNSSIIDYPTRLNCIICLRNLSLVEKPSKLRHDIIKSAFNSILDYLERGEDEQDFCHNAICTLANLSTDDKTAQLIASKRAIELLARFTEQGTNYLLQANALVCLANMCVDERACGQIFRIGNHSFIQLYTSTLISHELRQYIICILHNLIIQHDGASKYFSSVAGFLDELVMSMSSPDELTQNCALNIIHHYLSCKQTLPNLQRQIVECNPVSSLLVILHSHKTAAANKQLASKCFEIIIGIQDSLYGNGIDHFVRIRSEWDEADRIFALEHVSKKGGGGVGGRVVASKTTKMQPSKTSAIRPKSAPNKRS